MKLALTAILALCIGLAGATTIAIAQDIDAAPAAETADEAPPSGGGPYRDAGVPAATDAPKADSAPGYPLDVTDTLSKLAAAAKSKEWAVFGFLLVLALTYAFREWVLGRIKWAKTRAGGWTLAAGSAALIEVVTPLAAGAKPSIAIFGAFVTALLAAGKTFDEAQKRAKG